MKGKEDLYEIQHFYEKIFAYLSYIKQNLLNILLQKNKKYSIFKISRNDKHLCIREEKVMEQRNNLRKYHLFFILATFFLTALIHPGIFSFNSNALEETNTEGALEETNTEGNYNVTTYRYIQKNYLGSIPKGTPGGLHLYDLLSPLQSDKPIEEMLVDLPFYLKDLTPQLPAITPLGHLESLMLPDGKKVHYDYDSLGRLREIVYPDKTTISYTYTKTGNIASKADLSGMTRYEYDILDRLIKVNYPTGNEFKFDYDLVGNLKRITYPDGDLVKYNYNANNQVTEIINRFVTTRYSYDKRGNVSTINNPVGQKSALEYDPANRLAHIVNPYGSVKYTYNKLGNITNIQIKGNLNTIFGYDSRNRINTITDLIGTTNYTYNNFGNLASITNQRGIKKLLDYSPNKRLKSITTPLGATTYNYDKQGNLSHIVMPGSLKVGFTYDLNKRIKTLTNPLGITKYNYDKVGNISQIIDPAGFKTSFKYDSHKRLKSITDPLGTIKYKYNKFGNISLIKLPCGIKNHFTYDPIGKMKSITNPLGITMYNYNNLGKISGIISPGGLKTNFTYGPHKQLKSISIPSQSMNLNYNRLGNLKSVTTPGGFKTTLTYDINKHLKSITTPYGTTKLNPNFRILRTKSLCGRLTSDIISSSIPGLKSRKDFSTSFDGLKHNRIPTTLSSISSTLTKSPLTSGKITDPFKSTPGINPLSNKVNNSFDLNQELHSFNSLQRSNSLVSGYSINSPRGGLDPLSSRYSPNTPKGWLRDSPDFIVNSRMRPRSSVYNPSGFDASFDAMRFNHGLKQFRGALNVTLDLMSVPAPGGIPGILTGAYLMVNLVKNLPTSMGSWTPVAGPGTATIGGIDSMAKALAHNPYKLPSREMIEFQKGNIYHHLAFSNPFNINGPDLTKLWSEYTRVGPGSSKVGGVLFDKEAKFLLDLNNITGATFDEQTGQLILMGEKNLSLPKLDLEHLAVAIRGVSKGGNIGVSIDPGKRQNEMVVRYLGGTENTRFGKIMFEADRLLKTLSFGKDNVTGTSMTSQVPGFKTELDLAMVYGGHERQGSNWHRLWFIPEEITVKQGKDGRSMLFDNASIIVKAEYISKNKKARTDPAAQVFAQHFSKNYDEFAKEFPVLMELKQLAKIVGIAKWLKKNNLIDGLSGIINYPIKEIETPKTTPGISVSKRSEKDRSIQIISLYGGVDFQRDNRYVKNEETTDLMAEKALSAQPELTKAQYEESSKIIKNTFGFPTWDFQFEDKTYTAVGIPVAGYRKTGNFETDHTDLDISIRGKLSLKLLRYYSSFSNKKTPFGYGWIPIVPYQLNFPNPYNTHAIGNLRPYGFVEVVNLAEKKEIKFHGGYTKSKDGQLVFRYFTEDQNSNLGLYINHDETYTFQDLDHSRYRFDKGGCLLSITRLNGSEIKYGYEDDRLVKISHNEGKAINLRYDEKGRILEAEAEDKKVTYNYDPKTGDLIKVIDSKGNKLVYGYDDQHRVTMISDPVIGVYHNTYDKIGRLIKRSDSKGQIINYNYDKEDNRTIIEDSSGNKTIWTFDDKQRLVKEEKSSGKGLNYVYTKEGNLSEIRDRQNNTIKFEYSSRGNLSKIIDPLGNPTEFYYNEAGLLASMQNAKGRITSFHYNKKGNVVSLIDGYQQNVTILSYNSYNEITSITDANGHMRGFEYDDKGRIVTVRDAMGNEIKLNYDDHSRLTDVIDPTGNKTEFIYDKNDWLVEERTPSGSTNYEYDQKGNLIKVTDPSENSIEYFYDEKDNVSKILNSIGLETLFKYDSHGDLASISDQTMTFVFDKINRLIRVMEPKVMHIVDKQIPYYFYVICVAAFLLIISLIYFIYRRLNIK